MREPKAVTCPICGESADEGATACGNCGAALAQDPVKGRAEAHGVSPSGAGSSRGGTSPAGRPSKAEEPGVLYLCPECGGIVSAEAAECGKCGAKLALEGDLDGFLEGDDTRVCPSCKGTIPSDVAVCPKCHTSVHPGVASEGPTTVLCENCGATVLQDFESCESCGHPLRATTGKPVPTGERPTCRFCGAVLTPGASVCGTCAREVTPAAGSSPTHEEKEEMEGIRQLIEEDEPEAEQVAAGLERLANEMKAEEAVYELDGVAPSPIQVRPTSEVRVPRTAARKGRRHTLDWLRQTAAIATVAALAPAAYVATTASEVGSWAILAVFGSLQATAFAVSFLDFAPIRHRWRDHAVALLGGLLILVVPLHNAMGVPLPDAADGALLVFGTALALAGGAPLRRPPAMYAPWLAGLPGLVVASAVMAAQAPAGSSAIAIGTWAALAITVASSVVLEMRHRRSEARVSEFVRKAQDLALGRNYRGAIEELDRAIRLTGEEGPEDPWYSKGAALVVLGRYEEALACIETALRINPSNEIAWVNKGNALVRMGRVVDALKCYNSAIKVNPQYEVGWNNKGNALARLGKYDDALRCYEKALTVNAAYKGAWVNKGYVLTKLGNFEAAAKCADEVIRLGGPAGVGA